MSERSERPAARSVRRRLRAASGHRWTVRTSSQHPTAKGRDATSSVPASDEGRHAARARAALERVLVLRLVPARRQPGRLRAPGALPQPGGRLVLGLRGGRGPAARHRDRPRGAHPGARALEIRTEGLWADHNRGDAARPLVARVRGLRRRGRRPGRDLRRPAGRPGPVRLRPRVGDRRRRVPVPRRRPLRGAVPGPRRGARRPGAHRDRRARPARPLVGPAGLVDLRLELDLLGASTTAPGPTPPTSRWATTSCTAPATSSPRAAPPSRWPP